VFTVQAIVQTGVKLAFQKYRKHSNTQSVNYIFKAWGDQFIIYCVVIKYHNITVKKILSLSQAIKE